MVSTDDLSKNPLLDPLNIDMASFFSAVGGPSWTTFSMVQNEIATAVIRSKSKPEIEFQYGGRLFFRNQK